MKNVFLDTNILIDYVLNRPGGNDAEQLLMHGRRGDVSLSASLLTIANMAYILKGKRFWGNSSHAVVFCCCRDFYNYPNNMSQYERDMADPQNSLRLNYVCPEGTLAMAFANNPFLKLHVDKWKEFGVKSRVLKLVEEFRGKIEASNPDIHDDIK